MDKRKPWEIDDNEFLVTEEEIEFASKDESNDGSTMRFDLFCRYNLTRRSILICLLFNFLNRIIFNHIDLSSIKVEPSGVITDELR